MKIHNVIMFKTQSGAPIVEGESISWVIPPKVDKTKHNTVRNGRAAEWYAAVAATPTGESIPHVFDFGGYQLVEVFVTPDGFRFGAAYRKGSPTAFDCWFFVGFGYE